VEPDAAVTDGAWVAIPLVVRERPLGVLGLGFASSRRFDEEERAFVVALAQQCAQAIERARLFEAQKEMRAQAEQAADERESLVKELRRTLRERDESMALLDALFENAPVGLALLDREMRYVRVNAQLAATNGVPTEQHVGRSLWEVVPRIARDELLRDFESVLRTRTSVVDRAVTGPLRAGDPVRSFLVSWYPVAVGERLIGVGALVREVTEQRRAEQFQRQLLGVVGHDLRSPLMAITASAELLLAGPLGEREARSAGRILRAAHRIDGIIRALVDFTMLQVGSGIPLQRRASDLVQVVRAVAEEAETAHPGRAVRIEGPIALRASIEGPLAAPRGTIVVDHRGGSVVWRDPPVEFTDLHLQAELGGGSVAISDGSVGINRGRALFGGGWDRKSGQGIVMELEGVTFFVAGTLTQWSGVLAIEPDPERTARVSGDLVLAGGIWERPADLAGAFRGVPDLAATADDPLQGIALDLTVRAQTGVRVNNNLGRFDVTWDRLRVGGTAAAPVLVGDIRIEPGGVVRLPGKTVELKRGTIRFTGDPQVDPVLDLVPVEDLAVFGEEGTSTSSLDVYSLAAEGIYGELGQALGFENETLQPAEIAIETETDASSQILLGQRLSPNLAFFFAANPTDVRDRTTTLQLWNLDFAPGLAAQAYQSVLDESEGLSLIQRFRWGGSAEPAGLSSFIASARDAEDDDRPVLHKLRLDGEWPVSKRRLRRASGLSKGQPYDPFLAFVADVYLERELAIAGFPEARVRSRAEGSPRSPTLVFTCETGPRYEIEFVGDDPPKAVRREVLALYMPPPLEEQALTNMRLALKRHYQATGHPVAEIRAERRGDSLQFTIEPGEALAYRGPRVEGVDERGAGLIREMLGSPLELAAALEDPERAGRMVSNLLAGSGYPDARGVELAAGEPQDGVSEVRLVVDTGVMVRIAEVAVEGHDPLGATDRRGEALAIGAPLDRRAIDNEIAEIRRVYQTSGYDQVSIRANLERLADGSGLVEIQIDPGFQRRLEEVRFRGTRHIDPRYLRTGLDLAEGELLDVFTVDESAIDIANFAPVERVQVTTIPSGSAGSIVEFDVYEKPRWTVELGAGWDSERGFEARTGLRDDNLFGRGVSANLRLRANDEEKVALLYGSLPPLPGGEISLGGNIGYAERNDEEPYYDSVALYREFETLASMELLYEVSPPTTLKPYLRYTYTRREYENPGLIYIPLTIMTVGGAVFHDRFDNPFDPRSGYSFVTDLGWSTSYLGSDVDTVQASASGSLAVSPGPGWTWVQTLRLGVAEPLLGSELDDEVRFYAGGQGSIRGFDFESVGPGVETEYGIAPEGGGALFILNEELRTPLWKSLRGAVFVDTGQIWESWSVADWKLSTSVGLGLRWSTPVGLIWADAAWPVANVGISSRDPKFYFGIGRPF
jgi:PAS domain S-box-containing protein